MKNIRYVLASASYHKRLSILISVVFFIFLTTLTAIRNLIDINRVYYQQFEKYIENPNYLSQYKQTLASYNTLFCFVLVGFILTFLGLTLLAIRIKAKDLYKWRLMGFSTPRILGQFVLEMLFLFLIGAFFSALFTLVFQYTYEAILIHSSNFLSTLSNNDYSFFSGNITIEASPNIVANADKMLYFFDVKMNELPLSMIINALKKNMLLLSFFSMLISAASLSLFILINKKRPENKRNNEHSQAYL